MKDYNRILFLKINGLIGKSKWLDAFGGAGAEWVILGMVFWYASGVFIVHYPNFQFALPEIFWLSAVWIFTFLLSFFIGFLVKEPRPRVKIPESGQLFRPISNWKSFPSDHSAGAFLIFFLALIFHLPLAWALLPMALWVVWGRVYAGLHYPLDAVGGVALAALTVIIFYICIL